MGVTGPKKFDMPGESEEDFWLDLGDVREVAEVRLDGKDVGTAWTYPFRVKVSATLLTRGTHQLAVAVYSIDVHTVEIAPWLVEERNRPE